MNPLLGSSIPPGFHFARCPIPGGHYTLQWPTTTNFVLPSNLQRKLQKEIDEAKALENKVKQEWLEDISVRFPNLSSHYLWIALRGYLANAFLRHGIQTIMLLDPSVDLPPNHLESLSSILDDALKDVFPSEQQVTAKIAISSFLSEVGEHADRASYITQLADGAFNYFSLTVDPNVAEQFRQRLTSLVLFLDTNFLFGILDLHVNPLVQISNELLEATKKYTLPFKLKCHEATEKEMRYTIDYYGGILRSQKWSRNMSQLAITSNYLTGIPLRYHQLNAERGIDVNSFLKPYAHLDVLLKEKNISMYKDILQIERQQERIDLQNKYQDFLRTIKKDKPHDILKHDTTLLDTIHLLRAKAESSLEMGALFITCDYALYRFDWQKNRANRETIPCVVLPNVFWQVLRPFVSSDVNFNRSFAETFAIPEFRTINSGVSLACARLLSLLTTYRSLPEETAANMLSNDLLIDSLRDAKNDEEFKESVDLAIVTNNECLMEDKAALTIQLEREIAERDAREKKLEEEKAKEREQTKFIIEQAERERQAREDAENRARQEALLRKEENQSAVTYATKTSLLLSIMLSFILIGAFEFIVYRIPWNWLIQHINSVLIQATFDLFLLLFSFGLFNERLRKWCWRVAAFSVLLVLLQILAGH